MAPRGFTHLDLRTDYSSGDSDLVSDFFVPCLDCATSYDRAAAYFRSTVYHLIGVALSDFAIRGGQMRLVCAPSLTPEDHDIIMQHHAAQAAVSRAIERDIRDVLLAPEHRPVTELMATLLKAGSLQIQLAYRPNRRGIFHLKLGMFQDSEGNCVSFSGSENETVSAWDSHANYEGFEVFASWEESIRERHRVDRHKRYFRDLWSNKISNLTVTTLPRVPADLLQEYANADGIAAAVERARAHLQCVATSPTRAGRKPQSHQTEVIKNWWTSRQGIIDHVTGAGKTLTSIWIIRDWVTDPSRSAVIFVPSSLLARQWSQELRSELSTLDIWLLNVGGDVASSDWARLLGKFTHPRNDRGAKVVVATMQTACRPDFLNRITQGPHLLVVADEVHRIGSPEHRRILQLESGAQLGLSATPDRYFDPEGSEAIRSYFGKILKPRFSIADAQKAGRLVPYDYFAEEVTLTDSELARYNSLTKTVSRLSQMHAKDPTSIDPLRIQRTLQQRAQILKQAENKTQVAQCTLQEKFDLSREQRWLIYCDDRTQLNAIQTVLHSAGIDTQEYTSAMQAARQETLDYFERYGGVLLSIHCLDEGVDIPNITHALILASSVNPREHLQRRGRVLRKAPGKYSAMIFDGVVGTMNKGQFAPFRSEVERAIAFAADARNESVKMQLRRFRSLWTEDRAIAYEGDREDYVNND